MFDKVDVYVNIQVDVRKDEDNECIHPDCECVDYCEAKDPYSKTPERKENEA